MRVSPQVVRRSLPYLAPHVADRASIGQRPLDGHSGNDQEQSRDESRRPCVSYRRRQPVTGILLPKLSIQTGHQRRIEGDFRQQYRSRVHDIQNGNQAAQCTNAGDHNHPQIIRTASRGYEWVMRRFCICASTATRDSVRDRRLWRFSIS